MTAPTERPTHTPGPWEVNDSDGDYFYIEHVHPDDSPLGQGTETVAALARGFAFGGEASTVANARLIASAPALLAERDALRERVRTLREAIKPFAEISLIPPGREDYIQTPYEVDANDVTAARAALASTEAEVKP